MTALEDVWPLFGLRITSPRLQLNPIRDDQLPELIDAVLAGIHDPAVMPFGVPWTDAPPEVLVRETLKHQWRARCAVEPENWTTSEAADFNAASLRVSRSLGYRDNGVSTAAARPGEVSRQHHLRLVEADFVRGDWIVGVHGFQAARRALLGTDVDAG